MTKKAENISFSIFFIIISIFAYLETYNFKFIQSSIFPRISLVLLFLLSIVLILETIITSKNNLNYVKKPKNTNKPQKIIKIILPIFMTLLYISMINFLGFYTSAFLYTIFLMFFLGVKNFYKLFFISITFVLFIYIIFKIILEIITPVGIFV